jgi:putative addiction module killer protein
VFSNSGSILVLDTAAYFAEEDSTVVLLLIGGDKKTQTKDIKTAKAYWRQHRKSA